MTDQTTSSPTLFDTDVIIVGAGPVGLTLACALDHHKVRYRLFEQKQDASTDSKGHNLIARTQELLAGIGTWGPLAEKAYVAPATQILLDQRPFARLDTHGSGSRYEHVLFSGQNVIEETLADLITGAGGRVERGRPVLNIEDDGDGVKVEVGHAATETGNSDDSRPSEFLRCRYLVGADGVKGTIRKAIGLDFEQVKLPGYTTRQIDAKLSWRRSTSFDQAWFFLYPAGFAGVMPVWEGVYRLFFLEEEALVPERKPTLDEMIAHAREVIGDDSFTMTDVKWASWGDFKHGVAPAYAKGRVFLAGDAGHTALPIGGQGMNTGMHDAIDLAWRLAMSLAGEAGEPILHSYDTERRGVHAMLDKQQTRGFQFLTSRGKVTDGLLQKIGVLVPNLGSRVFGGDDLLQLTIGYSDSSLSEDRFSSLNPFRKEVTKAGYRAPDARLVDADGNDTTLFDQMQNPGGQSWGWSLLLFDGRDASAMSVLVEAARGVSAFDWVCPSIVVAQPDFVENAASATPLLFDLDETAHRAYGLDGQPALVLVRPDGHIAFRAPADDHKALAAYCRRIAGREG